MPIVAQCPLCGVRFKARQEYAGRRVKCPGCGEVIQIPVSQEDAGEGAADGSQTYRPPKAPDFPLSVLSKTISSAQDEMSPGLEEHPPGEESLPGLSGPPRPGPTPPPLPGHPQPSSMSLGGLPIWGWILIASALSGLIGGLVVYASLKVSGSAPATRSPTAPTDRAKSSGKRPSTAKTQASSSGGDALGGMTGQPMPGSPGPSTKPAKSVREILEAVVKLEMPIEPGKMSIGAGFLIDPRGWVATNYHVIRQATSATRVRLYDGTQCKLAGILAQEPSMDLAILKLADPPPRLAVLDISFPGEPEVGEEIQVCGHPHNLNFTFDKGTVGRVITTRELLKERPNPLLLQMKTPPDIIWIQHSARIAPGNSGGPVLNQRGQVIGVNSFVNELSFGYAVPVRYLRGLVALCDESKMIPLPEHVASQPTAESEPNQPTPEPQQPPSPKPTPEGPKIQPPPPTPSPGGLALSPEELQKLYDACCRFYWKPTTPEEYKDLEIFARAMAIVKYVQAHPEAAPGAPKEAIAACAEKADQLFKRLQESPWTKEHWEKIHALAADQLQPPNGILLRGSILMNAEQIRGPQPTILFAPEGIDRKLLLVVSAEQAKLPVNTKVWLIGRIVGTATLSSSQGQSETCPFAQAAYLVKEE